MRIGFVGYIEKEFDVIRAEVIALRIFNEIYYNHEDNERIEIVVGATNTGTHKIIYKVARLYKYKTVGVMCNKGYDYELFPVDKLIVVGENWGDESKTFLNSIDILYRIGGGEQSLREVKMAKKLGIKVIEYEI